MNPTEHEKQIAREAAEKFHYDTEPKGLSSLTAAILAAITVAKHEQNEETARKDDSLSWEIAKQLTNLQMVRISDMLDCRAEVWRIIRATRDVQPAAKEGAWDGIPFGWVPNAAKQPSAPTPTETGGQWSRYGSAVVDAAKAWEFGKDTLFVCASADDGKKAIALHNAALDAKDEQIAHELKLKEQAERELHAQDVELNALREQLRTANELLREIRDGEVNPEDEADKYLRDHVRSELSQLREQLRVMTEAWTQKLSRMREVGGNRFHEGRIAQLEECLVALASASSPSATTR